MSRGANMLTGARSRGHFMFSSHLGKTGGNDRLSKYCRKSSTASGVFVCIPSILGLMSKPSLIPTVSLSQVSF